MKMQFTDAWHRFKFDFRNEHQRVTGFRLAMRMFYWREVRAYYRSGLSHQQAVAKYLKTEYRRAA